MQSSGGAAPDGRGLRLAVAAACRHGERDDALLRQALAGLTDCRAAEPAVLRVSTPAQLPVVTKTLAALGYHGVVCVGTTAAGDVPDASAVWHAVTQVAVASGVAVGFAVLAPDRVDGDASESDLARLAAHSAVDTALLIRRLRHGDHPGLLGGG